ncbi:MAG TPA: hypothetical protein VJC18_02935, partial [bacterium]|nr:hypothetical protein [bacterium]
MLSRAKGKNQDSRDAFFCETFEQFTGRGVKKNGQYDVVSALNSLYVLTDKAQIVSVLNGIREHLVDGGQFMASILHEIDPENMLRAQFGLPRTEPKNDMASALKLGFSHDPLLTLRLFLPGVITKILGASSNTLLDKATWTRLIESAGLVIDDAAGYYGGANYGEPLPGTFFLAHKA